MGEVARPVNLDHAAALARWYECRVTILERPAVTMPPMPEPTTPELAMRTLGLSKHFGDVVAVGGSGIAD